MLVVETAGETTATVVYATGDGPQHDMNMSFDRYATAKIMGDKLIIDRGGNRTITLVQASDGKSLSIEHTLPDVPLLTGTLARAN